LGKLEKWFWYLGCFFVGLSGCQGHLQGSVQSPVDSDPSSYVEPHHALSLDPPYSLAILPLDNLSSNARLHWLGRSLSEMLTSDLAKSPSLSIIARDALGPVLREQWLQQRGFSSSISNVDLGNIQGVHYLVSGGFHQHGENLTIDLQVIDVETGVIVSSLRAQGPEAEIPRLEHSLVMQMLTLFDPSIDSITSDLSEQLEEKNLKLSSPGRVEEKDGSLMKRERTFGLHSVHQIDVRLSLERITQHRIQAYQAAGKIWKEGWSTEMGLPMYRVWEWPEQSYEPMPLLALPISLFMQPHKIGDVLQSEGGGGIFSFVHLESDGFVRKRADQTGASQLFFEQVRQPQRVFVRALNEHGELMAVFSKWSWRTEVILQNSSSDRIIFPFWPQPFISGLAEFPVAWVERGGQHVTFDAMMMPIPNEQREIVLEPIVSSDTEEQEGLSEISKDGDFLLPLKNWIQMKWHPPITEALPVAGYLPANKRNAVALLHLHAGKIVKVQFLHLPHDVLLSRSLEELKTQLIGYCVICKDSEMLSSRSALQAIRLQLNLVKDLHGLRFGSPLR
jgi:TolB-like protein